MNLPLWHWLKRLLLQLSVPVPEPAQLRRRIEIVERNITLPVKAAAIIILATMFRVSPWFGTVSSALDVAIESVEIFFLVYLVLNVAAAVVLLCMNRLPLPVVQWTVFTMSMVDCVFVAALMLVSGGYDSGLFWVMVGLIVRNAASVPPALSQLVLNGSATLWYTLAGVLEILVSENVGENLDPETRQALGLALPENPTETFLIRLAILILTTVCCYALQALLERQRQAADEARELQLRREQLRSAGRMAAEIAHQIKNPLAIINNAAFSLQRALREGRRDAEQQIQIIQEEVARSDRIVTELMDYAQLSEGRVERLDVAAEIDRALAEVFPPAARYAVQIERQYMPHLPALLMQRRHLSAILVNLFQNARDAMSGGGNLRVQAGLSGAGEVQIIVADNGPGIPPDKLEKIFEAYYTDKPKGTGLGLAIVKHNVELYGGTVRAESELGKGARFIVTLPGKSALK